MKQFILNHKTTVAGMAVCLLLGILTLSFQDTPYVKAILDNQEPQDTTPVKKKKHSMTMKEFDKLSADLDGQVFDGIKNFDFAKIEKEVRESLKEVDIDKILKEVETSMKEVDIEKIMADVRAELKNIDFENINKETRQALADAKKEMEKASVEMKKIDRDEIKKELENARLEVERNRGEISKINMDKIMAEAREGIDKAKTALKQLKQMFTEMEQDGLINSKHGFNIEYKDKNLYINGTRQTEQVTDKYRKYFTEEHFEITIDKE